MHYFDESLRAAADERAASFSIPVREFECERDVFFTFNAMLSSHPGGTHKKTRDRPVDRLAVFYPNLK